MTAVDGLSIWELQSDSFGRTDPPTLPAEAAAMSTSPAQAPWFAVQTKPRHEKMVAQQLEYKGYQPFLPTYLVRHKWSDRIKVIEQPLFDGYCFCRIDRDSTARVITTPGTIRIVGLPGAPTPIDEAEIETLQQLVASRHVIEPWPYLDVGQRVRIESGGLAGIEGILQAYRNRFRVIVSVTLLQRSVAVEVDRDAISAVAAESARRIGGTKGTTTDLLDHLR
jgi:transcription antitermination factor NusG